MDLYSLIFFVWSVSSLGFWIIAFNKLRAQEGGLKYFFRHLAGVVLVLFLFSLLMIASAQGCVGMYCGLIELLITIAVIAFTLFFYPLLLAFILAKNRAIRVGSSQSTSLGQEDILDDLI